MSAVRRLEDKSLHEADRIAAAGELGDLFATKGWAEAAWAALCGVAHDEDDVPSVRKAALGAMARLPAMAVNHLARPFRDPERQVRKEAVRLLRSIGVSDQHGLAKELADLESGKHLVLMNLVLSFGYDPRILAAYRKALVDPHHGFRYLAVAGLAELGETGDVASALADPAPEVRARAAEQLGYYSMLEPAEISALTAALNDPVAEVAKEARTALKRLGVLPTRKPGRRKKAKPAGVEGPWQSLLSSVSRAVLNDADYAATLDDDVVDSGWLGLPGATDAEIADLSGRLGRDLPPSYEAFLRLTNGFRRISPFIDRVLSAGEVRPFSVDNADWIAAYRQLLPDLETAIQISEVGDGVLLLNPTVITAEGEWEAWFFANWIPGERRHPSFLELVRGILADSAPPEPPKLN